MFRQATIASAAAALALGACGRSPDMKPNGSDGDAAYKVPSTSSQILGRIDDVTISLKEIAGDYFLIANGGIGIAMVHHELPSLKRGKGREFNFEEVNGTVGSCKMYQLDVHGSLYILAVDRTVRGDSAVSLVGMARAVQEK